MFLGLPLHNVSNASLVGMSNGYTLSSSSGRFFYNRKETASCKIVSGNNTNCHWKQMEKFQTKLLSWEFGPMNCHETIQTTFKTLGLLVKTFEKPLISQFVSKALLTWLKPLENLLQAQLSLHLHLVLNLQVAFFWVACVGCPQFTRVVKSMQVRTVVTCTPCLICTAFGVLNQHTFWWHMKQTQIRCEL